MTFRTLRAVHLPPRGVAIDRVLSSPAMALADVTPSVLIASMMVERSHAN
jgi:hypothetical protein